LAGRNASDKSNTVSHHVSGNKTPDIIVDGDYQIDWNLASLRRRTRRAPPLKREFWTRTHTMATPMDGAGGLLCGLLKRIVSQSAKEPLHVISTFNMRYDSHQQEDYSAARLQPGGPSAPEQDLTLCHQYIIWSPEASGTEEQKAKKQKTEKQGDKRFLHWTINDFLGIQHPGRSTSAGKGSSKYPFNERDLEDNEFKQAKLWCIFDGNLSYRRVHETWRNLFRNFDGYFLLKMHAPPFETTKSVGDDCKRDGGGKTTGRNITRITETVPTHYGNTY